MKLHRTAFENGQPVNVTWPELTCEPELETSSAEQTELMARFLQWLAADGNVMRAGRRSLLVAHLAGQGQFKTDRALAKKLNITPGRLSQLRKEIRAFLPGFDCNRRQNAKRRSSNDDETESPC